MSGCAFIYVNSQCGLRASRRLRAREEVFAPARCVTVTVRFRARGCAFCVNTPTGTSNKCEVQVSEDEGGVHGACTMFTEDRDDSVEPELGLALGQGPCNAVKPSWVCLSHAHWLIAIKERVKRPPIGIALQWEVF